jgi:hypothetical protein
MLTTRSRSSRLRRDLPDFFGCLPPLRVVHPPPVGLRPDDLQNRLDLLAELRPDPQNLSLLIWTWYNAFSGKPAVPLGTVTYRVLH